MKYSAKIYAKALCDIILSDKKRAQTDKIVANFLALVEKNQDSKKLKEILLQTQKILGREAGYRKVLIESARQISSQNRKSLSSILKKGDDVEEKIDPSIIAGVKITVNDELQFDGSLDKKIKNILNI